MFGFILSKAQDTLPVRGFCISAPQAPNLDAFVKFIEQELAPRNVNTLVLRVDYNYMYETHPELRNEKALSKQDIKQLVAACRKNHIQIIPQVNLLGHQSWASKLSNLLKVYPEFDETPGIQIPDKYEWPNKDGLYCKSYCPLHPQVHEVVFDLVDEICEVFEAKAFHAGMDEVFYIGHEQCPRCNGLDPAQLFAGEVNIIRNHLIQTNRELWIWGDRLIDGKTTGLGMWEASMNNTHRAIDLIQKDVTICDWHYERPDQTAVLFAMKGFRVITCPWRKPGVAITQTKDMFHFRETSTPDLKDRFQGIMQTIWVDADTFLKEFYASSDSQESGQVATFKALFKEIQNQSQSGSTEAVY
jgi:hypothetical protein